MFVTRIGPTAVVIDASAKHGIHSGDLLAVPMVMLAALTFFFGVLALERAVRPRSRTPWRVPVATTPVTRPVVVASPALVRTPAPALLPAA